MAFIDSTGRTLSEEEVAVILNMLKDSIKNHCERFAQFYVNENDDEDFEVSEKARMFDKVYSSRLNTIDKDFSNMFRSENKFNIEDILKKEFKDLNLKAHNDYEVSDDKTFEEDADFDTYVVQTFLDKNLPITSNIPVDFGEEFDSESAKFKLADAPMDGIEDIADFKANSQRITFLNQPRSGNSDTLRKNDAEQKNNIFRFDAATELSRLKASELKSKDTVSFLDLYNTFTELNQFVRIGDSKGGQLRGNAVSAGGGTIEAVSSNEAPYDMYKLMNTIAGYMNTINRVQDPALRKTQAIQLAAYAYQMSISAHLFADGNGRSCRLLADTILQAYDLPPHIPTREETKLGKTIGTGLNFSDGAAVFLTNVTAADQVIRENANVPKPVNSEITEAPDTINAIRWFRSLNAILEEKGFDTINFHDHARIRVLQDVQAERKALLDYDAANAINDLNPKCVTDYLGKANVPAFLTTKGTGVIELPKPAPGQLLYEHPLNYIDQNIIRVPTPDSDKGGNLSSGHIEKVKELYNMARNGRLNLYMGGEPESEHTHALTVDEDGMAHFEEKSLTALRDAFVNNEELSPIQRKIGSIVKEYDDAVAKLDEIAVAQKNKNPGATATEDDYKKVFADIHESINFDVEPYKEPLENVAENDVALRYYTGPKARYVNDLLLDRTYLKEEYNIPEGLSAEACSMIVFGAIIADENMDTIETGSSASGSRDGSFRVFKKSNFMSNVVADPEKRFAEYSSAIKTGRRNAVEAINEIKTHPEKAMKYVQNAVEETVRSIKYGANFYCSRETLPLLSATRELYKVISEEPFNSGLNISNEDKAVIEYGKIQADLLEPYMKPYVADMSKAANDQEKLNILISQELINYMSSVRSSARSYGYVDATNELTFSTVMEKAKEEMWGDEEYNAEFLKCKNFEELNKVADRVDDLLGTEYSDEISTIQDKCRNEVWAKKFLNSGINQWIHDTPADEVRNRMVDVLTNTREFRGKKVGYTTLVGATKDELRGINPFARYDVRNLITDNLVAIETASRLGLETDDHYNNMINSMKEMIHYIGEHPQNDLDPDSAREYRERLASANKTISDYIKSVENWPSSRDDYKAAAKSIKNVKAVGSYIDKELKAFDKNLEDYRINKEWDFEKEIKWYKSFNKLLAENGIDVTNPVSLLSVKIMGDMSKEAAKFEDFKDPSEVHTSNETQREALNKFVDCGYVPAYLAKDGKSDVKMPDNPRAAEPVDYYFKNTVMLDADKLPTTGEGISAEAQFKIKELYEAAKSGRLFIDHTGDGSYAHPVMLDDNGQAKLSNRNVREIIGVGKPANDFEKAVKANAQGYRKLANIERIISSKNTVGRAYKHYKDTVELKQKTAIMMKDYKINPDKYSKLENALKRADDLGASWKLKAPTSEATNNMFSTDRRVRLTDHNKLVKLAKEADDADKNVHFGSKKYDDFVMATNKLTILSQHLAKQLEVGSIEQANKYRMALLDVKQKADAYLAYKGDNVKDQKGLRRVAAARAISEFADAKYKGVLGTVVQNMALSQTEKVNIINKAQAAHKEADRLIENRRQKSVENAEKLYNAFVNRLKKINDKQSKVTLATISEPENREDFIKLAMKTNVVKSMVDNPNLFEEKGQQLVTDVVKEMSAINKQDAKQNEKVEAAEVGKKVEANHAENNDKVMDVPV